MHLQVTGRLDPGETYALIDLDVGNILPRGQSVKLDLVNIIICNQEGHSHFEPDEKAEYPKDPNRYPEIITVKRPRPRPLTFRRRTRLHVARLDPPLPPEQQQQHQQQEQEEEEQQKQQQEEEQEEERFRRNVPEEGEGGEEEIGDMDLVYTAAFRESIFEFDVLGFPQLSLDQLVNNILQGRQSSTCFSHFQRLLHHSPVYELFDSESAEDQRQRKKKVRIILPPLTRLMCGTRHFFTYLGMQSLVEQVGEKQLFALVNSSATTSKIFVSPNGQSTALKFGFYDRNFRPPEKYTLFFQRLNPVVSSRVSLAEFCNKSSLATAKLFSLLLNFIIEALGLPHGSLRAFLYDEEEEILILDKSDALLHNDDSQNNFTVSFKSGLRLKGLLGLVDSSDIMWKMAPGRPAEIRLEKNLYPEDPQICEKIISTLKFDLLNQTSSHPTVKSWQEMWKQYSVSKKKPADLGPSSADDTDFILEPPGQGRVLVPAAAAAAEEDANAEDEDEEDEDENEFMIVQVPNPNPRPPVSYTVANLPRKHICTTPNIFPEFCTLLLKEGEPTDYVKSRGLCSVLGMVRKLQPNIVSNANCVLKNCQSLKSLSVEFVDESENTFKVPLESPAIWIKLDIQCHSSSSY